MSTKDRKSTIPTILFLALILAAVTYAFSKADMGDVDEKVAAIKGQMTERQVRQIVKEYIQDNPDQIISSLRAFEEKRMEEARQAERAQIKFSKEELYDFSGSPFAGDPNGDVVVVEFFDYSCGYCKRALPTIKKLLEEDKKVKVVFKEYPILGPSSARMAQVALGIYQLDKSKYLEFHSELMKANIRGEDQLMALVEKLGFDKAEVQAASQKPEVAKEIELTRGLAIYEGIRGTPSFMVGGELIRGAIDIATLKAKIAEKRGN